MAASRVAGRYLLTNAGAEMGLTVVGAVASFEVVQQAGFTLWWWQKLSLPVLLVLMLWGFVTYRYRETRAMTLAQFFEIRYSKRFRIFAGILVFISGVFNRVSCVQAGIDNRQVRFFSRAGKFICAGFPKEQIPINFLFGQQHPRRGALYDGC